MAAIFSVRSEAISPTLNPLSNPDLCEIAWLQGAGNLFGTNFKTCTCFGLAADLKLL